MKIYFRADDRNRVIPLCDWTSNIQPDVDWLVGNIGGDAYNEYGIPLWKWSGGNIVPRTAEEIAEDYVPPEPTEMERMQADIDFLSMENEYLDEVTEQQQADIDYCLMLLDEE